MDFKHRHAESAFTLVEILIVAAILGILAAIVIPLLENQSQMAKESAAKDTLYAMRNAIERYYINNKGIPPGYPSNNINAPPQQVTLYTSLIKSSYISGQPLNPFNKLTTVKMIKNNESMPAAATGAYGWIYKPATKTFKIDSSGKDSQGISYYDY